MNKIIELTLHPFDYPVAFEITGIHVVGTSKEKTDRCIVNNTEVKESYREVIYMLQQNYHR